MHRIAHRVPHLRLTALVVSGALLLGACGSSGGGSESSSSDDGSTAAASSGSGGSSDAFPVTVEHKYGETTIDEKPERIVTVGLSDQDAVLALGEVPVATTEWFGEQEGALWPWAQEQLQELDGETPEVLDATDGVNIEAVAAQKPDLITAMYTDLTEADYEKLSQIAPVITQSDGYVDYGITWQEMTTQIGKALGRSVEAEELVAGLEGQLSAVAEENPDFDGAQGVVATPYEGIFVYGPDDPRGRFLTSLGFVLPEGLVKATGEEFGGNLSEENAKLLDGDLVIWLDPEDAEGDLGGPAYETFAVHTEGREVMLDSFDDPLGAATSFITPLSIPFLIDGLVPKMAAAIDGDPSTEVPE